MNIRPDKSKKYLLAFSGGADSCVMAWLLHRAGAPFALAHVNYNLRGRESRLDEKFARDKGAEYGVPVFVKNIKLAQKRNTQKSLQEDARNIRYKWLEETARKNGYHYIVTAHHANDQAETMLLNLFRGSGIRGLKGIAAKRGNIIRPLLGYTREEILEMADRHHIAFRNDSSNNKDEYDRNYIRHHLVPVIEKRWKNVVKRMQKNASQLQEQEELYNHLLERESRLYLRRIKSGIEINCRKLASSPFAAGLLYAWLQAYGFTAAQCQSVQKSTTKTETRLFHTTSHTLHIKNGIARISAKPKKTLKESSAVVRKTTRQISQPIKMEFKKGMRPARIPVSARVACMDLEKVGFPLTIRKWKNGDRFRPLGMRGSKKISDLLTDLKMSAPEKEKVYVLADKQKIVWVIGLRMDDRVKTSQLTKNCLIARLK